MDTDELNKLIRQLNANEIGEDPPSLELVPSESITSETSALTPTTTLAESTERGARLKLYLTEVIRRGATDLLLVPGAPPTMRFQGALIPLTNEVVEPDDAASFLVPALPAERKRRYDEVGSVDLAIGLEQGRFRINLHKTRRGSAAAIRLLPKVIPSFKQLGLPSSLEEITQLVRGLVLITGPTGCGKSTTLAAIVDSMNSRDKRHIVTIEDPVEYEHIQRESVIEQIEVGSDASSFADALRAALRQSPDVILVGEMRDLETIATALTAAETGHLVLATLHTNDAAQTIHRIVDVFPSEQQPQIRQQLSMALAAIIYQQLMVSKDGKGRVVACEILIANDPIRNHIRKGNLHHLHTEMTLGRKLGMLTLEDSLAQLVREDLITEPEARAHAVHVEEFQSYLKE
jgi:twitching motility protein PilT